MSEKEGVSWIWTVSGCVLLISMLYVISRLAHCEHTVAQAAKQQQKVHKLYQTQFMRLQTQYMDLASQYMHLASPQRPPVPESVVETPEFLFQTMPMEALLNAWFVPPSSSTIPLKSLATILEETHPPSEAEATPTTEDVTTLSQENPSKDQVPEGVPEAVPKPEETPPL